MIQLQLTTWHDQPAWALESDHLRVVTVPGMGAKIVSVTNKVAAHEWLLGPADRPFQPVAYGASFVEQDMSGWDEMYPTINACAYPGDGPHAGTALPDHGEVWALAWEVTQANAGALTMRVNGRALPYTLTRTLTMPQPDTLHMAYTVENTGTAPLTGLWAAHPQFAASAATEIRLPADINHMLVVQPLEDWGAAGSEVTWPIATTPAGAPYALHRVTTADAHKSRKLYTLPDQPVEWAMLVETNADHWLRMDWDAAQIPYLGVWVDEGHYNPALSIALEPATGFYDDLALAWQNQRVPVLAPGAKTNWALTVTVGQD